MDKNKVLKALEEIKKQKKNFDQSVDLIINLKKIDIRKNPVNAFIQLPHSTGEKKIAAFLSKDVKGVFVIKKDEFKRYEGREAKKLAKQYEFFIASAPLMPQIATTFGRILGPLGKMPSPQLGILGVEDDKAIEALVKKMQSSLRIKAKEPSLKLKVGKQSMDNKDIEENIEFIYNSLLKILPNGKDNIKNVLIKLTMGKPKKIE